MTFRTTRHHRTVTAQTGALILFLGLSLLVSTLGGILTAGSITTWYPTLVKPSFNPPNWLFGPVWSLLYLMMAIAAWRVWRVAGWHNGAQSLALHILQLLVNLAWSALFFGLQRPDFALIDCLLLLVLVIFTALSFWRHDNWAAGLMVPYILWVGFACLLNSSIVTLN
jgi:tryptophan-rich sensory protein